MSKSRLSLLHETSRSFCALIEIEELIPLVIERSKELLGVESSALLLLDDSRKEFRFYSIADVNEDIGRRFADIRFPADRGIAGAIAQSGRAEIVPDVANDPRWYPDVDTRSGMKTHSLLGAPLRTRRGVIGVIQLRNKLAGDFTADDLEFLDTLTASIAIAIENASLYTQLKGSEAKLRTQVASLRRDLADRDRYRELIGTTKTMRELYRLMDSAATTSISVLIQGETGTGKELVARAIHRGGARAEGPFIAVNCAALPETLLESQLFGHRKGSFTGAARDQAGFFEAADGGTIFLDEIGEMPAPMQARLLRVLQEAEVVPIGDTRPQKIDVRVLSATNRQLTTDIREGRFRQDLYYRLAGFPIAVPSLRERREDIPMLAAHFLTQTSERHRKHVLGIDAEVLEVLIEYAWPGNVRELQNVIERAVALVREGENITLAQITGLDPLVDEEAPAPGEIPARPLTTPTTADPSPLRLARAEFEARYIRDVLERAGGNVTQAAKALGLSRAMLHQKIRELGLRTEAAS